MPGLADCGRLKSRPIDRFQLGACLVVSTIVDEGLGVGGTCAAEVFRHPRMSGLRGRSGLVLENYAAGGNAERDVDVPAPLDGGQVDHDVGTAGENVKPAVAEVGRRVNLPLGGERFHEIGVEGHLFQQEGRLHAGTGRLGRQRQYAVPRRLKRSAAIEPASNNRGAHDVGRMGDVELVRHERAGRYAGDGNLPRIDGKAPSRSAANPGALGKRRSRARVFRSRIMTSPAY